MPLYKGVDSVVGWTALADHEGNLIDDGVVEATLYRGATAIWGPETVPPVEDEPGNYLAVVPDTLEMTVGELLTWVVTVESGSLNDRRTWNERVRLRAP